jgi:enoyl-CoA hydratase
MIRYAVDGRVARITLDRPEQANAITPDLPRELTEAIEAADVDPRVHVIALTGAGPGFCGGYDLQMWATELLERAGAGDSVLDPAVQAANHRPGEPWDPLLDYQMMSRCSRAWLRLRECDKPTVVKVQGFAIAGGSDIALCADLLVIAADAKVGYPPMRVWGIPSTGMWVHRLGEQRAKRLLFTGDSLSGEEAEAWGLAIEAPAADQLDARFEALVQRIAQMPVNQLIAAKLVANHPTQPSHVLSTLLDGVARHTAEGHEFVRRAAESGFRDAVRERDDPYGDAGRSTFKG